MTNDEQKKLWAKIEAKLPLGAGIIGGAVTILYWILADTPAQCVGKVVCQQDDRMVIGIIFGVLAGVVAFFVLGILSGTVTAKINPAQASINQTAHLAKQKIKYEKNNGKWDSVPKVVCPHCQEVGKVEKFVPPVVEDQLKSGMKYHLAERLSVGGATESQIEKVQKANRKGEIPNMRCSNCTVEWRV